MLSDAQRRHLSDILILISSQREPATIFVEDQRRRLSDPVAKAVSA